MTDFSIDVGPFNGVVNGVDGNLGDVDTAKQAVINTADDLMDVARDADLTAAVQQFKEETLAALTADSASCITSAISGAREARDAFLEFDRAVEADTPAGTGS